MNRRGILCRLVLGGIRISKETKMEKTRTEEIQYLGQMLTATTDADIERLGAIVDRLRTLYMQVKPRPNPANGAAYYPNDRQFA